MTDSYPLPPGYRQAEHLVLLEPGKLLRLNIFALVPLVIGLIWMSVWWLVVLRLRGYWPGGIGAEWPSWFWTLFVLLLSIIIHEGLHGLGILYAGHKPRFGVMLSKAAFYATADGALFSRNYFILIALLPIVGITLLGMLLAFLLPDVAAFYVSLGVALNAANAIGDLWMTVVVLRYQPDALVRDEADSIRIYTKTKEQV